MKYLVTGASGYLGARLCRKLLEDKELTKLIAVDNLYRGQNTIADACMDERFEFIRVDVTEHPDLMDDLYREADIILPLAGLVGMGICERFAGRAWAVNTAVVADMVIQIRGLKKKVIIPTSISGYGKMEDDKPLDETAILKPLSVYGRSKIQAEELVLPEGYVSLRLSTLFGPSSCMRLDLLVNNFTWDAYTRRNITLFQQNARRCYVHIDDAVDAFIFVINNYEKMQGEAYNVAMSDGNLTKRQLADEIAKQTECHIVEAEFAEDRDARDYFISGEKLKKVGWQSQRTLSEGIEQLLRFYRGIDVKSANVFADNWVI